MTGPYMKKRCVWGGFLGWRVGLRGAFLLRTRRVLSIRRFRESENPQVGDGQELVFLAQW
jgi:hypothetical protein